MSLNGLDDPKVREAYTTAAAEPGGWFLLKYASRDEVELLGRGNGGIVEVRNAIAQYDETAPLYGFLRYRRRNVIIKYLPEECSRLVQARVSVHFNSVSEKFAPYDTIFSIANSKELKDTKLSAACSLHAASGSTSSSTSSLRRRRLMEIAEEEEEEQRASKRQSIVQEERPNTASAAESPVAATVLSPASAPPVTLNSDLASSPEESRFAGTNEPPAFLGVPRPPSPAKSFDAATRRMSSQSTRPDFYTYASYGKPKVKLGPRPSLDVNGRPRTAGNYRPVSSIPAGFKLFSKSSKKGKEKGQDGTDEYLANDRASVAFVTSEMSIPEVPPLPEDPEPKRPHTSGGRPSTSSGVSMTMTLPPPPPIPLPPLPTTATPAKQKTMTPEKARLMKAMKLREQKKKLSMMPPAPAIEIIEPPADKQTAEEPIHGQEAPCTEGSSQADLISPDNLAKADSDVESRLSISKSDSGLEIDGNSTAAADDHVSIHTESDSHPTSPIAPSSELDDSTQASSLSESTDETIHANQQPKSSSVEDVDGSENEKQEDAAQIVEKRSPEMPVFEITTSQDDVSAPLEAEEAVANDEVAVSETSCVAEPISESPAENVAPAISASDDDKLSNKHDTTADNGSQVGEVAESNSPDHSEESPGSPHLEMPASESATSPMKTSEAPAAGETTEPETEEVPEPEPETEEIPEPESKAEEAPEPEPKADEAPEPELEAAPVPESQAVIKQDERSAPSEGLSAPSEASRSSVDTKQSKRKALVEPIKTGLDKESARSDAHLSDDDELMDELQSATVQEAKPVTVSKSPITPVFPSPSRQPSMNTISTTTTPYVVRTTSNPVKGTLLAPGDVTQSSARSVSSGAAFLHKITQQQSSANLTPKSGKLGSGISQRIKALEMLSANNNNNNNGASSSNNDNSSKAGGSSSGFFSVRKAASREPSRSPSVADRIKQSGTSGVNSRESSPETVKMAPRERSASVASKLSLFENGGGRGRTESIQVTARIVRDPSQPFPKVPEPRTAANGGGKAGEPAVDFGTLDLKQSPLVVDVQRAEPKGAEPKATATPAAANRSSSVQSRAPSEVTENTAATTTPQKETIQERRFSRDKRKSQEVENSKGGEQQPQQQQSQSHQVTRRRSSLSIVKDFIKERRNSLVGGSSPAAGAMAGSANSNHHHRPSSSSTSFLHLGSPSSTINTPTTGDALAVPSSPAPSSSHAARSPSSRPPSTHQNSSFPRRLSIGSRRSSMSKDASQPVVTPGAGALSPSTFTETSGGTGGGVDDDLGKPPSSAGSASGSVSGDKKNGKSRAGRFIRRLSSSLGGGRKNMTPTISPTVAEEDASELEPESCSGSSTARQPYGIVAYMGDVNVQFPDNLLWKRRSMSLDSQGFIILSPVQGPHGATASSTATSPGVGGAISPMSLNGTLSSGRHGGSGTTGVKRYHISDFRAPYTPEMELQELPNSVVLDFVDGSGLQIACEDRAGQLSVLHTLLDAHRNHTAFGQ